MFTGYNTIQYEVVTAIEPSHCFSKTFINDYVFFAIIIELIVLSTAMFLSTSSRLALSPALVLDLAQDGKVAIPLILIRISTGVNVDMVSHPWQVRDISAKSAQNVVGQERSRSLSRAGHQGKKVPTCNLRKHGDHWRHMFQKKCDIICIKCALAPMESLKEMDEAAGSGYLFLHHWYISPISQEGTL